VEVLVTHSSIGDQLGPVALQLVFHVVVEHEFVDILQPFPWSVFAVTPEMPCLVAFPAHLVDATVVNLDLFSTDG